VRGDFELLPHIFDAVEESVDVHLVARGVHDLGRQPDDEDEIIVNKIALSY